MAIGALVVAGYFRFGSSTPLEPVLSAVPDPILAVAAYAVGWPVVLWTQGLYRTRARWTIRGEITDIIRATFLFAVGSATILFLARLPDVSRGVLLILFPILAITALVTRLALRTFLSYLREGGRNTRYMLVLGVNGPAQAFADMVESQ